MFVPGVVRQGERYQGSPQSGGSMTYAPDARAVGPAPGAPAVTARTNAPQAAPRQAAGINRVGAWVSGTRGAPFGLSRADVSEISNANPRTYHIPAWDRMSDAKKVQMIRKIAMDGGRNPEVRAFAVAILRAARVEPRDYPGQVAAILRWVQDNIYYANESGEILQDASYTLRSDIRHGDCDDATILVGSLFEAVGIPWRIVLSGQDARGAKVQWVEGTRYPGGLIGGLLSGHPGVEMAHIYLAAYLGGPVDARTAAANPGGWSIVEPTLKGSPVGADPAMNGLAMPEMGRGGNGGLSGLGGAVWSPPPAPGLAPSASGTVRGAGFGHLPGAPSAPDPMVATYMPVPQPPQPTARAPRAWGATRDVFGRSAYGGYGYPLTVMSTTTAASNASAFAMLKDLDWKYVASATIVGVATSVAGQVVLDAIHAWREADRKK